MAGTREIPKAWRESVRECIEDWVKETYGDKPRPNTRELAKALKMKQPTVVQLLNLKGGLGLHVLLQVRAATGRTIDELLGLGLSEQAIRRILREELAAHDRATPAVVPKKAAR